MRISTMSLMIILIMLSSCASHKAKFIYLDQYLEDNSISFKYSSIFENEFNKYNKIITEIISQDIVLSKDNRVDSLIVEIQSHSKTEKPRKFFIIDSEYTNLYQEVPVQTSSNKSNDMSISENEKQAILDRMKKTKSIGPKKTIYFHKYDPKLPLNNFNNNIAIIYIFNIDGKSITYKFTFNNDKSIKKIESYAGSVYFD